MKTQLKITYEELYNNCIYSSIAHAVSNLRNPFFSYMQSWDGMSYSFQYGTSRGTITFDLSAHVLAGAARDETSERISWYPKYRAIDLFKSAPEKVKSLATNETLEYLYDEANGVTMPIATIAFWNEENKIFLSDELKDFSNNGGEFILNIIVNHSNLRKYWLEENDFNSEELEAVDYLFDCFKSSKLQINSNEISVINEQCDGYTECLDTLKELGFVFSE